ANGLALFSLSFGKMTFLVLLKFLEHISVLWSFVIGSGPMWEPALQIKHQLTHGGRARATGRGGRCRLPCIILPLPQGVKSGFRLSSGTGQIDHRFGIASAKQPLRAGPFLRHLQKIIWYICKFRLPAPGE